MHKKPQISKSFQVFMKETPRHAKAWVEAVKGLGHACVLDHKTRELAYIGILAALGMDSGMDYGHSRKLTTKFYVGETPLLKKRLFPPHPLPLKTSDAVITDWLNQSVITAF